MPSRILLALVLLIGAAWVTACAADTAEPAQAQAVPYAEVQRILVQSCAKQVCHGFMTANAHLDLMQDPLAALVNVPACEYDRMLRVAPGDPEHSWLMVKIAGPTRFRLYADFVDFVPDRDWQPTRPECSGTFDDGSPWFGLHMPPPDTTTIAPEEIAAIAAWIRGGARPE